MVVVLGPLIEGLLVYVICRFAGGNFPSRPGLASILVGIGAGGGRAWVSPFWFFGAAASFAIWSFAWFKWKASKRSNDFLILLVPHMIQNAVGMLMMTT